MACRALLSRLPVLPACTVRSRTRCGALLTDCSVASSVPSQLAPFWALAAYCSWALICERRLSEVTVPVGESDGRLRTRPLLICSWSLAVRFRLAWTLARLPMEIECCVTRIVVTARPCRRG